jgi:uncharacterized membrane protein YhaH (DUF805 family)
MKAVAVLMILIGAAIGLGAALEFGYFGPESRQFWIGVFTTPAGVFFVVAGVLLLFRGLRVRGTVLLAALLMLAATIAATALQVMGPPATLLGIIGVGVALVWYWRTRSITPERVAS